MTSLWLSFKANSTRIIHQFTVNVTKDTKIEANTFINSTVTYTA